MLKINKVANSVDIAFDSKPLHYTKRSADVSKWIA
jgi:hypothetical protein